MCKRINNHVAGDRKLSFCKAIRLLHILNYHKNKAPPLSFYTISFYWQKDYIFNLLVDTAEISLAACKETSNN